MPQFVPVYDPERPRAEQNDEEETILHRKWDAPHQLHTKPIGVSDRNNFVRMAGKKGGLIQNEKGLWVPPDKVKKAEVAAEANKVKAPDVFPSHRPFRKRLQVEEEGSGSSTGSSEDSSSDSEEGVKPDGTKLSVDTQDSDAVVELVSKAEAVVKKRLSKNPYQSEVEANDNFDYQPPKSKSNTTTSADLISNSPYVALCDDGEEAAAVKKKIRDAETKKKKKQKKKKKKKKLKGEIADGSKTIKKKKKDGEKKEKSSKEAKKAGEEKLKPKGADEIFARSVTAPLFPAKASKNEGTDIDQMIALGLPGGFV